jgi:hypothetical protein
VRLGSANSFQYGKIIGIKYYKLSFHQLRKLTLLLSERPAPYFCLDMAASGCSWECGCGSEVGGGSLTSLYSHPIRNGNIQFCFR